MDGGGERPCRAGATKRRHLPEGPAAGRSQPDRVHVRSSAYRHRLGAVLARARGCRVGRGAVSEGRGLSRRRALLRGRSTRELAGGLACVALVLLAYHSVAFGGKTFDASTTVPGVNGTRPPTGVAAPHVVDGIRVDRGSAPWQTTPWAQ